jgi:hypothetical protein
MNYNLYIEQKISIYSAKLKLLLFNTISQVCDTLALIRLFSRMTALIHSLKLKSVNFQHNLPGLRYACANLPVLPNEHIDAATVLVCCESPQLALMRFILHLPAFFKHTAPLTDTNI